MKAKLLLTVLLSFSFYLLSSQVPQGINYQALASDGSGNPIRNASIQVKISILSDTIIPVTVWEELHSTVKTSPGGVISLVVGSGVRQPASSAATFGDINWSATPLYIKTQIYYLGTWKSMGSSKLWTVPYAMVSGDLSGTVKKLSVSGQTTSLDEALFEVKNKDGQTIFAVYNEGVRVYVDNGAKGAKGGFAIGGFSTAKSANEEYLRVTRDSTRVYVSEAAKGAKGGFAIGGFSGAKGSVTNFTSLTPDNYFIGHQSGGKNTSGLYNSFLGFQTGLNNASGSNNVFLGYQAGLSNGAGNSNVFLGNTAGYNNNADNNVFLGYESGYSNTSGTTDAFIGYRAGRSNTTGFSNVFVGNLSGFSNTTGWDNVMIGDQAGSSNASGNFNVMIGYKSGFASTLSFNTFIGYEAGSGNITGEYNAFMGYRSGWSNTGGSSNVFIGNQAGISNTTGNYNSFLGYNSGYNNTIGGSNVFIGESAGRSNTTGNYNTIIGELAGSQQETGYSNIFIGSESGYSNISGRDNTFLGGWSGYYNTGSSNVMIGSQSGVNNINGLDNTFMGYMAGYSSTGSQNVFVGKSAGQNETGSGKLYIANSSTSTPLIGGDFMGLRVGINRMPVTYTLEVGGTIWANGTTISAGATTWSDARYKTDIAPLTEALSDVLKMQGVKYNWRSSEFPTLNFPPGEQIGVIAQDMEKIIPQVVYTDADGYKSVYYEKLTPVLIEAVKEQQRQITSQQVQLNVAKTENKQLRSKIIILEERIEKIETQLKK